MADLSPFHWLVVAAILVLLHFKRKSPPGGWKGPRGGPPHPLPVTGLIETSKRKRPGEKDSWALRPTN